MKNLKPKKYLLVAMPLLGLIGVAHAYVNPANPPMSEERLNAILNGRNEGTTLDQLPAILPKDFVMNFTLLHGLVMPGQRGHLAEEPDDRRASADPQAPRTVIWDERSGYTLSYNGGTAGQTHGDRLDIRKFDAKTKKWNLTALDFPVHAGKIEYKPADCISCHGVDGRPIFAMYPDWPGFYGSDNDELGSSKPGQFDPKASKFKIQALERDLYLKFRKDVSMEHPRYAPLFSEENIENRLGISLYPTYPYRQNLDGNVNTSELNSVSRSFAFRASLRFGIVMNRLHSQAIAKRITDHPRYSEYGTYFLHEMLQCRWPTSAVLSERDQLRKSRKFLAQVQSIVPGANLRGQRVDAQGRITQGGMLHYRQLLGMFGLKVDDVDMRYSYGHEGYKNEDASKKIMEVGYIGSYWNSYFDGSATIDELVSYQLFQDMVRRPGYGTNFSRLLTSLDGLVVKYRGRAERFAFDRNFFTEMDKMSLWIPIPYPRAEIHEAHHREGFPAGFQTQHGNVCQTLEAKMLENVSID